MYHGVSIIIVVGFICDLVGHRLCLGILFTMLLRVHFLSFLVDGS
jgi:hypothetical protein